MRVIEIAKIGLSENLTHLRILIFTKISRCEKFLMYGKLVKFVAFLGFVFSFTFEFFTEIMVVQAEQLAILDISEKNSIKPFFLVAGTCSVENICLKHKN